LAFPWKKILPSSPQGEGNFCRAPIQDSFAPPHFISNLLESIANFLEKAGIELAFPLLCQGPELWKLYCFHPSLINWPQPQRRLRFPEMPRSRRASSRSWPAVWGKGRMGIWCPKIKERRTRIPLLWLFSLRPWRGAAHPDFPRKRKILPDRRSPTGMGNRLPSPALHPLSRLLYQRFRRRGQKMRQCRAGDWPPFPSLRPLNFVSPGKSREDSLG
jgi:hypothetical protein